MRLSQYRCPICRRPPTVVLDSCYIGCINDNCLMPPVDIEAWKTLSSLRNKLQILTEELKDAKLGMSDCTMCQFLGCGDPDVDEIAAIKEENRALRKAFILAYHQEPKEAEK